MDDALIKRMDEIAGKIASGGEHAVKISQVDDVKGEIALVFGDQEALPLQHLRGAVCHANSPYYRSNRVKEEIDPSARDPSSPPDDR